MDDTTNVLIGEDNTVKRVSFANLKTILKTIIGNATTAVAGLFSASDKTKLDAIDSSIEGKTVETSISGSSTTIPTSSAITSAYTKDSETLSTLNTSSNKPVNSSAVSGALTDLFPKLLYKYVSNISGTTYTFELQDYCFYELYVTRGAANFSKYVCAYFGGETQAILVEQHGNNPCTSVTTDSNLNLVVNVADWGYITTTLIRIF